jgi:hypothetical protein
VVAAKVVLVVMQAQALAVLAVRQARTILQVVLFRILAVVAVE